MKKETILKIADAIREAEKQNGTLEYCSAKLGWRESKEWKSIEHLDTDESADNIVLRIRITNYIKHEQTKRLPTIEEVEKWFLDNKVFAFKLKPYLLYRIETISTKGQTLRIGGHNCMIKELCEDFSHYDGSELYITEN